MSLTDYNLTDKRIWQAGRDYELERIIKILEDAGYPPQTIALFKGDDK